MAAWRRSSGKLTSEEPPPLVVIVLTLPTEGLAWDVAGQLYLVDTESGIFHKVMSGNLIILDMRWSPDSLHVAFAAMTSTGTFSVYVADTVHPDQTARVVSAGPFANPKHLTLAMMLIIRLRAGLQIASSSFLLEMGRIFSTIFQAVFTACALMGKVSICCTMSPPKN